MASPHQVGRPLSFGEVVIYPDQSLGFGAYGKVCNKCGQLPCAAKLLHDTLFHHNDPGEKVLSSKFERECEFLSTIRHPNIVQYLTTAREPTTGRAVLLMELMDESLKKYLERSVTPLPCHIQVDICHDVALALAYLHSNGVIHRDLSSNNVLLIAGRRAKVTDFGMSKLIDAYQCSQMTPLTQAPGTQYYMPPEALITPPQYTYKLDCFSFGVLTVQIASGNYPTPGEAMRYEPDLRYPNGRVIVAVPERERRANDVDQVDPRNPLYPIALDCIKDIDEERPTASALCEQVAEVKEGYVYKASIEAGEGNSPKNYIELQRVRSENQALERELAKTKQSRQQILGELNLEKREVGKLRSMEQQVGNGDLVRKLERRRQGLAVLLTEVRRKLVHTEQLLVESQQRERELQERDVQRIYMQRTALGYKEEEVQNLRTRVKECEGIISDFQAMDLSKEHLAALDVSGVQRRQSSPTLRPLPNPMPAASTAPASSPSAPQLLAPPIPEWREAKPPPEEMTGYTGQVTVHEGTAYFTQNFVVYAYHESRDKWEELPRCENKQFGVAMVRSRLTAIGGLDRNNVHINDVLTLKEREKKWEKVLPAMPTARVHPATITTPTHLVVAGGTYVSQEPDRSSKGYATVEVMALNTLQWSMVSSLPEVVRYPQLKHVEEHLLVTFTRAQWKNLCCRSKRMGCGKEKPASQYNKDLAWLTSKARC